MNRQFVCWIAFLLFLGKQEGTEAFLARPCRWSLLRLVVKPSTRTSSLTSTHKRNSSGQKQRTSFPEDSFVGDAYDSYDSYDDDDDDSWFNEPFPFDASSSSSSTPAASNGVSTPTERASGTVAAKSRRNTSGSTQSSHFFSRKQLDDFAPEKGNPQQVAIYSQLCRGLGLTRPSKIQALAWPVLRQGVSAIVAEQTGSGKTLGYLIPLLERMLSTPSPVRKSAHGTPRIIILAPTAELADQTRAVCDQLSQAVPFHTLVITATGQYNTNIRDQIRKLQRTSVDVLISTPGRLSTILRTRNSGLDLAHLQAIVLDEVDILLLDDTFGPQLRAIGQAAPVDETQFVFCTATLPDTIVQTVQREFPNVKQIRGPGLHKVAPTVNERLVDVSVPVHQHGNADFCFDVKAKQLLKALRVYRCHRTLIFCNTIENCRLVENLLKRHDRQGQLYQVGAYHNALAPEARQANLRALVSAQDHNRDAILVCTDRAARGVDFGGMAVDHVVVFDFPSDPAEYVRRVGRTARAGRTGTCTVLAYGWQLPIARSVMTQGTLQEFRAAEEKQSQSQSRSQSSSQSSTGERIGTDSDHVDDWSRKQKRVNKQKRSDMKANIENGRLWT